MHWATHHSQANKLSKRERRATVLGQDTYEEATVPGHDTYEGATVKGKGHVREEQQCQVRIRKREQ